ncbi:L-lysine 6-monooxygenase [Rhodococcus sp. SRB_17]|uniref:lysine N(6)-hydroxylase/L-ornithine N(5)-oxygenase family protein n=1 Tax=Rhodococcus sp. OK302 TaxID=1882769 RepID=UPI000B93E7E4|nr:SidA/IucD/PvdA family monooxygenase [Rhodococcus sp. OK302]NMM85839.1 L-lysine 6-monooxygenase [Rhodococcus sp. SRB_17]OYD69596.1 L-ornithine N5-oxygenase [Rhodococcus sp. OK302]
MHFRDTVNHQNSTPHDDDVIDVIGVGFGPSNLGLAIAIREYNEARDSEDHISARFVESKPTFGWHPGMLIPDTTMQVSFLKDLATQRNTTSRFTFLNFLAEHERLSHFVNYQTFFPTRIEFHKYLEWAAATVDAAVDYGTRVVEIISAGDYFEVTTNGQAEGTLRARNIVMAGGLTATLPDGVSPTNRQFHNHNLLFDLAELPPIRNNSFVVVGAGQSAAEVARYLHSTYPQAEVHAVFGKYGYSPSDDSPYANRIFDPVAVDDFYSSSPDIRDQLLKYHRGTNYSAVDLPLIEELYALEYAERVQGPRRLFVHGASSISAIHEDAGGVDVTVEHRPTGLTETFRNDAVIYATGFKPMDLPSILGPLCNRDDFDKNGPSVTRDYRLITNEECGGSIFLQGGTEHSHGLTSSLLSNIAIRSGEILATVASHRATVTV